MKYDAVLFDLDGTLVDTAPDMVAVLLDIQKTECREPVEYAHARNYVSHGAAGLIGLGFPGASPADLERLRLEFLERYEQAVCIHSTLFPGLDVLLDRFDDGGIPWGIVTNKPERMTTPLLINLGIAERSVTTISGDTIAERKPDPAPLLLACAEAGVSPQRVIYVGDAARDITAGRAAGMFTVAATYGYVSAEEDPAAWNAHAIAANTEELARLLLKAVNLVT